MSIIPVSMTSLQNLIEGEKFYRRDFNIVKQFNPPNDTVVYHATVRTYTDGVEIENYATKMGELVFETVPSLLMDQYEEALYDQRLSYSMILSTPKHVYTAYHTVKPSVREETLQ